MKGTQTITYHVQGKAVTAEKELEVRTERSDERMVESQVVNLYPDFVFQEIEGFGGAMTESAAYLLANMTEEKRNHALQELFGKDGMGFRFLRVSIDSCDYSLSEYQAVPDPISDPELRTFSIGRDKKYVIPMIKAVMAVSDRPISVMLSPWSPPYQWKTAPEAKKNDASVYGGLPGQAEASEAPGRCNGGSLKPEYYGSWAKYVVKYVQAYLEEGIPVTMLSLQNETVAATNWDSCVWTPEAAKTYLKDYFYPELKRAGLTERVGIYIWDHNKERMIEHITKVLDEETLSMAAGVAFHWYSGDHFEALELVNRRYPKLSLMLSECCTLHAPGKTGEPASFLTPERVDYLDAADYAHDIIGNLNHGMNRWIDWNLAVDEQGGPRHVPGGFTSGLIADGEGGYRKPLMCSYVMHFSHFLELGARRIGYSKYGEDLDVTAAVNPDGSRVIVLLNRTKEDSGCWLRTDGTITRVSLPAETISTVVLTEEC